MWRANCDDVVIGDGRDTDGLSQSREKLFRAQKQGNRAGRENGFGSVDRRARDHFLRLVERRAGVRKPVEASEVLQVLQESKLLNLFWGEVGQGIELGWEGGGDGGWAGGDLIDDRAWSAEFDARLDGHFGVLVVRV